MAWYNKYRPQSFEEVLGQDLVKTVLLNALQKDKIKQAYLLSGPKGVGKTTLARIFARSLNNINENPENQIDIIELDAASNTGIDNIRQLIESSKNPPISGPYKVYIIDEVHMLSKPAMNALLKILEEPPNYLVFLLATTNPEKLLPTVLSRLTKLSLTAHTAADITSKLVEISQKEALQIDQKAISLIAQRAQGSHRDSINLLETVASYGLDKYTEREVAEILGILPQDFLFNILLSCLKNELNKELLEKIEATGVDGQTLLAQLLEFCVDRSFKMETEFDSIILPLAETLELRFSINSPITALAILKTRLFQDTSSVQNLQPKKLKEIISFSSQEGVNLETHLEKKTPSLDLQSVKALSNLEIKEPVVEISDPTSEAKIEDVELLPDENTLINFLNSLTTVDGTPPIFKMLLTDLQVQEVNESKIVLSVSSGVFLTHLSSSKIQSFLQTNLLQKYTTKFQLETILRDHQRSLGGKTPLQEFPKKEVITESVTAEKKETLPKIEAQNKNIFYKVYNNLPENMTGKGVEVIKGPLPGPAAKDDWDEHAESMFELE